MTALWEQADVFPLIARIIREAHSGDDGFVSHDEIVSRLKNDPEGERILTHARERSNDSHTDDWLAHNMIAWFSQTVTVGTSDWADEFERVKIDRKWAYRPIS